MGVKPVLGTSVLITGATSGFWTCDCGTLSAEGYRVFGTGRNPPPKSRDGFVLLPLEVTSNESVTVSLERSAQRRATK